jgi:hypothetical protein
MDSFKSSAKKRIIPSFGVEHHTTCMICDKKKHISKYLQSGIFCCLKVNLRLPSFDKYRRTFLYKSNGFN